MWGRTVANFPQEDRKARYLVALDGVVDDVLFWDGDWSDEERDGLDIGLVRSIIDGGIFRDRDMLAPLYLI